MNIRHLLYIAENADKYYYPGKRIEKNDGTFRQTYGASKPLKDIQRAILRKILYQVRFPPYLLGGIKGGSHIKNARLHCGKKILVGEDVENFFPSVDAETIEHMWKHCFHFPPDVALILTNLTTYQRCLPQGASTSTYIANLIFWDKEYVLDIRVRKLGFTYSRYVDDCNASSGKEINATTAKSVKSKIRAMYSTRDLRAKQSKGFLLRRGERMTVHNLTVNDPTPTISKAKQSELKNAVAEIESQSSNSVDGVRQLNSLKGKLNHWKQVQPHKATPLLERLEKHKK